MCVGFDLGALGLNGRGQPGFTAGYRVLNRGASYVRISTPPKLYWWNDQSNGGTVLFPRGQTVNLTLTPLQPANTLLQVCIVLVGSGALTSTVFSPAVVQWQAGEGGARAVSVTLPSSVVIDARFSFGYSLGGSDTADVALFADGISGVTQLPMAVTAAYPYYRRATAIS